ncbi:MAG: nitroreductase family deazaflavin-dependent oxidoreductase [Candidatus Heimdallarchaeota archaeon]|nr:nitroreductase family deazaflavin-dependent oxidoreductase [Candidatus Heimdallarchaeota archaeon]
MKSSKRIPTPGSWMYNMCVDPKSSKRYLKIFKILNKIVVPLYRIRILPAFGFGFRLLLLTTKGRKTGKQRRNPVEYFKIDNVIYVVSGYGQRAYWYRNIVAHPGEVHVQVGFRSFHAVVEIIEDKALEDFFRWLVVKNPKYAKAGFGWDPNDDPNSADFSYIASLMRVIELKKPTT